MYEHKRRRGGKNESKLNYAKAMYKNSFNKGRLSQVFKTGSIHTEKTGYVKAKSMARP